MAPSGPAQSDGPGPERHPGGRGAGRRVSGIPMAVAGLLPGALLGAHFAGLLFFLNPHVPYSPGIVARGMLLYALLFGLGSFVLLLPFALGRPRWALRLLPWGVTAALVLAALLDWIHASYYAYYLPPGINVRLIKAAVWLTATAVVCFYTALLHSLAGRRYGPRSRAAFVLLPLLSLYTAVERREAFNPPYEPPAQPAVFETGPRPTLLVVGLDAATLDVLLPLANQGVLPFFSRLIEGGTHGHLASMTPNRSDPLWTTLATGKLPHKHGIVSSWIYPAPILGPGVRLAQIPLVRPLREWSALSRGGRRVDARDRRALPLWEILARVDVPTGTLGWPATQPVSQGLTFSLSDRYFADPTAEDAAVPVEVAERGLLFRLRAGELDPVELAPFGGSAPGEVVAALAQDRWRSSLATFLLRQDPDLGALFLVLPGLRRVSRSYYGGYDAVHFEGVQREPYIGAAGIIEAYYVVLDRVLEELWRERRGPGLLAVVSAYGSEAPSGWQRLRAELSEEHALQGNFDRSPDGVLLLYGQGVAAGGRLTGARLVDVVPTLLYALGFPVARDMDGQVLRQAFTADFLARHPQVFLPSYEALPPPARAALRPSGGPGSGSSGSASLAAP